MCDDQGRYSWSEVSRGDRGSGKLGQPARCWARVLWSQGTHPCREHDLGT